MSLVGIQAQNSDSVISSAFQTALRSLSRGIQIQDVTLTGHINNDAGAYQTVVLEATTSGAARTSFSRDGVTHSEASSMELGMGQRVTDDGKQQTIPPYNSFVENSWFCPAITLQRVSSRSGYKFTYQGQESWNSRSVLRFTVVQLPKAAGISSKELARISRFDLLLDPATMAPVALQFNVHPDTTSSVDIPTEIRYGDFRDANGVLTPFRIQKFENGSLSKDMTIDTAKFNTGVSDSAWIER
jgi:hypothetical protein